jgi:hypothetical protein
MKWKPDEYSLHLGLTLNVSRVGLGASDDGVEVDEE